MTRSAGNGMRASRPSSDRFGGRLVMNGGTPVPPFARASRQIPPRGPLLAALPAGEVAMKSPGEIAMNESKLRFAPVALLLGAAALAAAVVPAAAARADMLADWADKTTEIATDGPNTIRT